MFREAADSVVLRNLALVRGMYLWSARSQVTSTRARDASDIAITKTVTDTSVVESVARTMVSDSLFTLDPSLRETDYTTLLGSVSARSPNRDRDGKPSQASKPSVSSKPGRRDKLPPAPPKGAPNAFPPRALPPDA
jgi:hypothetical protein